MASLRRTRPENLDDLTIQVAIVRPGPIQGGAVNPYIARRQQLREDPDYLVPYDHPSLESVLKDTLGTIIFQDQVLEVAIAFAGFSPGEAEGLRRAMSRKRSEAAIEAYHRRFVEGAVKTHGADEPTAERVYEMIMGFSGFGFPKAHGAAFGLLAYQSTWLRVHYGPEFLCALLNEQPMGFYASDTLVPAREEGGPFRSLGDVASRAGAGRPALAQLAWAGACDSLRKDDRITRREVLWELGIAAPGEQVPDGTQLALPLDLPEAPVLRELEPWESMIADYATTGLTLGRHPMALLRSDLPAGTVSSRDLDSMRHE